MGRVGFVFGVEGRGYVQGEGEERGDGADEGEVGAVFYCCADLAPEGHGWVWLALANESLFGVLLDSFLSLESMCCWFLCQQI